MHVSFTMLDLRRLRLLRELATRGTIGAVATELDYSPSAVSQQLAQLEKEAGVPLLERVGRNVRLTAAAQTLVGHADVILARVEAAEADLQATAELITGTVRVAAIQSAGLHLLAPALRRLSEEHPALRVEVTDAEPETSMPSLALGSLDLVLADEYPLLPSAPTRGSISSRCSRSASASCCRSAIRWRPAAARWRSRRWRTSRGRSARRTSAYAELAIRACRALGGFEPDVRHRSNDLLILLALVANGQAVTLLPDLVRADREPASSPATSPKRRSPAPSSARSAAAARGGRRSMRCERRCATRRLAFGRQPRPHPEASRRPGGREPAAERGGERGDLLHVQRRRRRRSTCTARAPGMYSIATVARSRGRGQRVTHHAVGAAVHDRGHAARLAGAVERHGHAARRSSVSMWFKPVTRAQFYGPSLRRL